MSLSDEQERDRAIGTTPPGYGETRVNAVPGTDDRPSTIYDVAGVAGVSTATVSRVVNGVGNVSDDVRARVLTAISRLQFRPNSYAVEMGRAAGGITRSVRSSSACLDPPRGKS
jgi:hypothetical protein